MRDLLIKKYNDLFEKYGFDKPVEVCKINSIIKESLQSFLKDSKNPAIYCNGEHTQILMADFMYELKKVKCIIDNYTKSDADGGFLLIKDEEIEKQQIDAVIISTFKFRKDIRNQLEQKHPNIPYLDIYEEFIKNGINLQADYYYGNHPYHHYHHINALQRKILKENDCDKLKKLYWELISHYIQIKDFSTAIVKVEELENICPAPINQLLLNDLKCLYNLQMDAVAKIDQNNVVMFCLDGLRNPDLSESFMPKLKKQLDKKAFSFENAYSFSTSTFESLIPVYSENNDLRTEYNKNNSLTEEECRFVREAKSQNRNIYFYTDMDPFVEGENIKHSGAFQTATEKIWNFIIDAVEEKNGLFYLHILYESHFTFSNPYTTEELISEGTAMLFEFLPQKGGKLRTDFNKQHLDALHYLDDVVAPFVEKINCYMLLFADHGNLILDKECRLEDVPDMKYTCAQEWIQIPYKMLSPEQGVGRDDNIISLMSLNEIIISMMQRKKFENKILPYVKVARSELYNPDFRFLYGLINKEQYLLAFEAFIFEEGYKLVVYSNGVIELYDLEEEKKHSDYQIIQRLFELIKSDLTVCDVCNVKLNG